jgi:elongation factor Ts
MSVRRAAVLGVAPGIVAGYVHNAVGPDLGKIGVLVALRSAGDKAKLAALGRQLAMHIAFAAPLALNPEDLPADIVARERAVQADIARQSGKPENVIEKMLEGRMRKFYEESVLLSQIFQSAESDGKTTVAKTVEAFAKQAGAPVEITGFVRYAVGEGIEKETADFAAEVKSVAGH